MSGSEETPSGILAAIETRFENLGRVRVEVPEWGCSLFFPEDLTVARQKQIRAGIKPEDEAALMASFILHQAQLENGSHAFEINAVSRATMEGKSGMKVLLRIMSEVGAPETIEAAKNA